MNNLQSTDQNQIVVFTLDEPLYALYLSSVERVVSAVEITPLPKAPEIVLGVINVRGQIIPVVDIRKRFNLPEREMSLEDQFIIARTPKRVLALVVDSVVETRILKNIDITSAEQTLPFASYIKGVAKMEDNLILIYDLDQFLSLDEEQKLDKAIQAGN